MSSVLSIKAATKYASLAWVYQQINREKPITKIKAFALAVSMLKSVWRPIVLSDLLPLEL